MLLSKSDLQIGVNAGVLGVGDGSDGGDGVIFLVKAHEDDALAGAVEPFNVF